IVGSGYIACELAGVLNALGSEVTLLLRKNHVLAAFDTMLGDTLIERMREAGIHIRMKQPVAALSKQDDNHIAVHLDGGGTEDGFDQIIWAIGRVPNTKHLGLETTGLIPDRDASLPVDPWQNTPIEGLYAVGDVTGQVELTPVAIAAGRRLADRLFGGMP